MERPAPPDSVQLPAPPQAHRRVWLLLGWGMVLSVVVLSLVPLNVDLDEGRDKIAHSLAYAGMSFWFGMLFGGRARQSGIAVAFAAMGVVIEFLQGMTGYRTFDPFDMIANGVGAALGWGLVQTPLGNALGWTESRLQRLKGKSRGEARLR